MRKPPTALIVIVFALVVLVAYVTYTPRAQQPGFLREIGDRIGGGAATATGTPASGGAATATGTATGGGTATATGTATKTATPGTGGQLAGTWAGSDTQTDSACDYTGSVRLILTQSAATFAGTATYTLDLTRDKVGGFCLPTRNYTLAVVGAMDGPAITFNIGGAWKYTGTIESGTLRAVGTVTSAGITTTDTMTVARQ